MFDTHLSADDHALEWSVEALTNAGGKIERQLEAPGVSAALFDLRNLTR